MRKTFLLAIFFFVITFSCKKDNEKTGTDDYLSKNSRFQEISNTFIKNLAVNSICIDRSGYKWIGTDSGLFIFNNEKWFRYSFFNGRIINSLSNHNNKILIATSNGAFTLIAVKDTIDIIDSLYKTDIGSTSNFISVYGFGIFDKKWIGSHDGLAYFNGSAWKWNNAIRNNLGGIADINSMAFRYDDCFFGTFGTFLFHIYYNSNITVDAITGASQMIGGAANPLNNFNGELTTDTIYCVYAGSDSSIWFGSNAGLTRNKGATSSQNGHGVFEYFLKGQRVHTVMEASDSKIWAGTENGLTVFDGIIWTDKSNQLTNNFVTAIAFDKDGSAWIGTKKGIINIK